MPGMLSCIKSISQKPTRDQGTVNPGIIYFKCMKIPCMRLLSANPPSLQNNGMREAPHPDGEGVRGMRRQRETMKKHYSAKK